jgi:Tol biopolymer transport system component
MKARIFVGLTLLLMSATAPVLCAKERILLHRIGPSESTLFIAKTDGSEERPLLPSSGFDYNASFSADGKWIIFTSERGGSADIYRVHPDGSNLERLTDDPAYDDQGALSPDGKHLAFVSSRGSGSADIWVLDLKTREVRNLTHAPASFRPSWSPDGKWIAFSSDRNTPIQRATGRWEQLQEALYLMRPDGTGLRRLTLAGKFDGSPKWSPDSKRVVFYEMDVKETFLARRAGLASAEAVSQIVSMDVVTGARLEHTSGPGLKVSPQFVTATRIGYVAKVGPHAGLGFTSGQQGLNGEMRNPSWSPDGKWVVYQKYSSKARPQNESLFSRDPEFELVYSDPFPAFSQDGKKLALSDKLGLNDPGALPTLSVMDVDGGNVKHIFHQEGALVVQPEWSPTGDWIAFGAGFYFVNRSRPATLMMARPDGSELRELSKGPGNSGFPSWSPDGKRIVYRVWGESEHGLRIVNLEDGSPAILTTGYDNFPAWSPLGDVIAFTSFRDNDFDIYTIRPDGTGLKRLTTAPGNDAYSVWSPDGKHILFSSARLGFKDEAPLYDGVPQPYAELFVMDADGANQRPLTDNQWEDGTPAWAPQQNKPSDHNH